MDSQYMSEPLATRWTSVPPNPINYHYQETFIHFFSVAPFFIPLPLSVAHPALFFFKGTLLLFVVAVIDLVSDSLP